MSDMKMLPSELKELMSDVAHVKLQDFHLGRVLEKLVTHLAHAHGLDTAEATANEPESTESTEGESAEDTNEDDGEDDSTAAPPKPTKGKK